MLKSISSIKLYLDPCCPKSWLLWKRVEKFVNSDICKMDIIPVSNYKMVIMRLIEQRNKEWLHNVNVEAFHETLLGNTEELGNREEQVHYLEVYKKYLDHRSLLPHYYMLAIKEHFPDKLTKNLNVIGARIWIKDLPVHRGCHLSTCARESGLEFRESEFVISRLTHRLYRKKLDELARECLTFPGTFSPFIRVSEDDINFINFEKENIEKIFYQ